MQNQVKQTLIKTSSSTSRGFWRKKQLWNDRVTIDSQRTMKRQSFIDWENQWAQHCPVFKNGKAHLCLPNKIQFELMPGPGFGDYSHPTTQLMLELMPIYVSTRPVFDIGCGSGILSIAAAKMGASKVYCCDIDPEAVLHTQKNGWLNGVELATHTPPTLLKPVILMNMIASEQMIAWNTYNRSFEVLITSGILKEQENNYLSLTSASGWEIIDKRERDEWIGYIFKRIK